MTFAIFNQMNALHKPMRSTIHLSLQQNPLQISSLLWVSETKVMRFGGFFSCRICSIFWQHKLSLEFIFPVCQNQPWSSLCFKYTTTCLNSLTIDIFSICQYHYHVSGYRDDFVFSSSTVYKQKNPAWCKKPQGSSGVVTCLQGKTNHTESQPFLAV